MSPQDGTLQIVGADRIGDGVIISFSDGTAVLYHTQFLYDVRNQYGNHLLPDEDWGIPGVLAN
jgi:hypothetical protein